MNADPEEAAEFTKNSKRENRVYVGNLSYDVRYRDLIEFMRGGGLGTQLDFFSFYLDRSGGWSFGFGFLREQEGGPLSRMVLG